MPIKILQINTVVNFNATGRIAEDIGQEAIKNGWDSIIAYGRNFRQSQSKLLKIGTDLDFKLHILLNRIFDIQGFGSKRATKKLIKQIDVIKPDIIHLHNLHGYYLHIGILFQYLTRVSIPVVWTLHDCWAFTGHCAYFDFADCNKWITGCFHCPQKKMYPKSWFADRSKYNYKIKNQLFNSVNNLSIISVSNWLGGLVNQSFLRNNMQYTIHNGIDLSIFCPQNTKIATKKRIGVGDKIMLLGVASVWEPRKGLTDFIKLSSMISDDYILVIVGLSTIQMNQIPAKIIGIQRTENIEELVHLYSAADLFLNLTYEDNYPTTNMESIACGTPVLTYNTGGSVESITEDTGFIIQKGELESVCKVIRTFKEQESDTNQKKCRIYAETHFNKKACYDEYFKLYHTLLKK